MCTEANQSTSFLSPERLEDHVMVTVVVVVADVVVVVVVVMAGVIVMRSLFRCCSCWLMAAVLDSSRSFDLMSYWRTEVLICICLSAYYFDVNDSTHYSNSNSCMSSLQ